MSDIVLLSFMPNKTFLITYDKARGLNISIYLFKIVSVDIFSLP